MYFNTYPRPWPTVRKILLEAGLEKEAAAGPQAFTSFYLVRFTAGQPEIDQLKQVLARAGIDWGGRFERSYSPGELAAAPLLWLSVTTAPKGEGGPAHGTTYELSHACPQCGTGAAQTSALVLKAAEVPKAGWIFQTLDGEILVSRELASALVAAGISGAEFRATRSARDGSELPWLQVLPTTHLPHLAPATRGMLREDPCPHCDRDGYFHSAHYPFEPVYRAADVAVERLPDVVHTWECFGNTKLRDPWRDSHFAQPLLLVKPKVMLLLKQLKVRGVAYDPVRVE